MYEVKVFDTIHNEELKKAWLFLQNGDDMTAFQHYEWYCMLEEEFKSNKMKKMFGRIQYIEVLDNGEPALIAPLHIQRRTLKFKSFGYEKGICFLGMRGYSDYLNMIYNSIKKEMCFFLLDYLTNKYEGYRITLSEIREDTEVSRILESKIKGIITKEIGKEICVQLNLPESSDLFFKGMSKQFRQNYRTQKHRCEKDGIILSYQFSNGCFNDRETLDCIQRIHKDRFESKNQNNIRVKISSFISRIRGSYDEIGYSIQNNSDSWLLLGYIGDELVSYIYGMKDANAVRIMQLGFLRQYSKYSPGITILIDYLLDNFESYKHTTIDFTRGDEPYKFRMGGTERCIKSYSIMKEKN